MSRLFREKLSASLSAVRQRDNERMEASPIFRLSFSCSSAEKSSLSFFGKNVQNLKIIFIFAANVWFCSSVAFWCKQKGSICATRHLLFSTSPSPSPFPFPILELKISRFRILKRTRGIEFVSAIFNNYEGRRRSWDFIIYQKAKTMTIHLLGLRKDYFVQKVFVFKLLCLESFCWETILSTFSPPLFPLSFSYKTTEVYWKGRKKAIFQICSIKIEWRNSLAWSDIVNIQSCRQLSANTFQHANF